MPTLTIPEVQAIQAELLPIKSKRHRIMYAMQKLLKTVDQAHGYNQNIYDCTFDVKGWRDKAAHESPTVYVIDDTTILKTHAGCVREYEWTLRLFGVVREKSIQEFEEFMSDVEEAIYTNNTLFGECNLMRIPEITTDNQLFSGLDGTHLFEVVCTVLYTRRYDQPK